MVNVRGSPMVPLVGNIFTICTNVMSNGTIGKEIGANGKNGNTIDENGNTIGGADWRRGRVVDSGPKGPGFNPQLGRLSLWP